MLWYSFCMTRKAKIIIGSLIVILAFFFFYYFLHLRFLHVTYVSPDDWAVENDEVMAEEYFAPECNVAGINLHGEIMTYVPSIGSDGDFASAEDILYQLEEAERTEHIKAVILEIDSYGGLPVASEEIANKIKSMQKPVIAMIRSGAASGGYWVASAADRIFASKLSDIGSIGVTMSYLDESKLNDKDGYTWNSLSTGKFKDSGSDQKPLTAEERALFERDIQITFEQFIAEISANRKLSIEKVRALADGSTMMGAMALEQGLIDEIGSLDEIKEYIAKIYAVEPEVCW